MQNLFGSRTSSGGTFSVLISALLEKDKIPNRWLLEDGVSILVLVVSRDANAREQDNVSHLRNVF